MLNAIHEVHDRQKDAGQDAEGPVWWLGQILKRVSLRMEK